MLIFKISPVNTLLTHCKQCILYNNSYYFRQNKPTIPYLVLNSSNPLFVVAI